MTLLKKVQLASFALGRSGGYGGEPKPDPIPNSAVKLSSANGTKSQDLGESVAARPAKREAQQSKHTRTPEALKSQGGFCLQGTASCSSHERPKPKRVAVQSNPPPLEKRFARRRLRVCPWFCQGSVENVLSQRHHSCRISSGQRAKPPGQTRETQKLRWVPHNPHKTLTRGGAAR
jgi:hypothetical protein